MTFIPLLSHCLLKMFSLELSCLRCSSASWVVTNVAAEGCVSVLCTCHCTHVSKGARPCALFLRVNMWGSVGNVWWDIIIFIISSSSSGAHVPVRQRVWGKVCEEHVELELRGEGFLFFGRIVRISSVAFWSGFFPLGLSWGVRHCRVWLIMSGLLFGQRVNTPVCSQHWLEHFHTLIYTNKWLKEGITLSGFRCLPGFLTLCLCVLLKCDSVGFTSPYVIHTIFYFLTLFGSFKI